MIGRNVRGLVEKWRDEARFWNPGREVCAQQLQEAIEADEREEVMGELTPTGIEAWVNQTAKVIAASRPKCSCDGVGCEKCD